MSLDLPLVRGHVDAAVALRESVAPVALMHVGEADVILVDGAGFVPPDEAETSPSGASVLWRLSGDKVVRAVEGGTALFIGVAQGRSVIAIEVSWDEAWGHQEYLCAVGWQLDGDDAALAVTALTLAGWYANYCFCPHYGAPVQLVSGGWAARCEAYDRLEYPRQGPAIIVLVEDRDGHALLAHNVLWRSGLVSIIVGYVEAGESPDITVAREVAEEVGVDIEISTYIATRPWPLGRLQMMGYWTCTALPRPTPQADSVEIEWACLYSRDELAHVLDNGETSAPGCASIVYVLLREWYGKEPPSGPDGAGHN